MLVVQKWNISIYFEYFVFLLTDIVGDSGVDEVSDELHHAAVGVSVIQ